MQKQILKISITISILLGVIFFHIFGLQKKVVKADNGAVENLEELINVRKSRQATNTFYSGEQASSPFYWQPQTLMYNDADMNREVWKLSNTRSGVSHIYYSDIAMQPWSANGNRFGYTQVMLSAQGMSTGAYANEEGWKAWFIANTDGTMARPIPGSPVVCSGPAVFPWSPINPDKFYWFGETHCGNGLALVDTLYSATVSDSGVTRAGLFSLGTGTSMQFYSNGFSADGRKAMARQSYLVDRFAYKIWPITLYPTPAIDIANGYTTGRPHDGTYWGSSPDVWSTAHSGNTPLINLNGAGDYWYYWVDSYAEGTGFLTKLLGNETDGGAGHTVDHSGPWNFSDFGENVPIMTDVVGNSPWPGEDYWSHPAFDRWGKYVAYSDSNDPSPYGLSVEGISEKTRLITRKGGSSTQHNVWTGWTDKVVSTRGASFDNGCLALGYSRDEKYINDKMYIKKYDDNSVFIELLNPHTLFNNDQGCYAGSSFEYSAVPRPGQSPDGTKVAFHSTFTVLKSGAYDGNPDMFWTVAYYPYPPEIKSASKDGSNVKLAWDFNQGTAGSPNYSNPRTYTKRGWPNETVDRPAAPREIKNFRVWSSDDNLTWTEVETTTYNNCSGNNECGMWTESSWILDVSQANNTTKYYAITSVEHSGLESKTLSNSWKVTTDGSGNIINGTGNKGSEENPYPSDPGGRSNFFITSPDEPTAITWNHKQSPATADGQYTLTWSAPTSHNLIRYYNIYASDLGVPSAIQQMRIASIPATSDYDADNNFSYIDWLGNTDGLTQYKVTAVDFQGNESGVAMPTDLVAPSAPSVLSVQ
jgi:hypothetical protein